MCTESNIIDLPSPRRYVPTILTDQAGWLKMLRDDSVSITLGAIFTSSLGSTWQTRPRSHESRYSTHYLFYSPDAGVSVQLIDRVIEVPPFTLMWFPPAVPYALQLKGVAKQNRFYRFRFAVTLNSDHITISSSPLLIPDCEWFPRLIESLHREMIIPSIHSNEQIRNLILQLSLLTFRSQEEHNSAGTTLTQTTIIRLKEFAFARIHERIMPADLAEATGLSPAYFTRIFKKTIGISPRRWLLEQRIRHGAQLLIDTTMNISEIAYQLGYDEPRLFTRQFSNAYGVSPRIWRRDIG